MGALIQDVRYAIRRLAWTPGFTLGALVIMAIAIGANTAAFAVVNQMLFTPPPFDRPEMVVNIYQDSDDGEPSSSSYPAYRDMVESGGVFQSVAATSPEGATLEMEDGSWSVAIEYISASFMETIGRTPVRGRWFEPSMDQVGAGNFAVVSHHAWQRRFGSDPGILGRVLRLNGEPVTIIGVGPADFNGIGGFVVTDFWLSISSVGIGGDFRVLNLDRREDHWYDIKARLAEGASVAQAQDAMNALALRLAESFPELNEGRGITVYSSRDVRLHPEMDGSLYPVAGILLSVVVLILILASSNLGGLLLVRGVARGQEVAVRRAMGATPSRVASLFLSEAFLLSFTGGVMGLLLATWLLDLMSLVSLPGALEGQLDLGLDIRVLFFTLTLMVGTGLFFGWAPAMQSLSPTITGALREDGRTGTGSRRRSLLRNLMVSVQVAVSLILVVAAGIVTQSLANHHHVETGVDAERLALLQTDFTRAGLSVDERGATLREITDHLGSLPGVERVALSSRIPLMGGASTTTVVEDYEPPAGTGSVELPWSLVGPHYFATAGIEVVEGRAYRPEDQHGDEQMVIVNQAAADRFWGGVNPVGRRIRPQSRPDEWIQVVGVVSDTKVRSLSEPTTPMLYYLMGETGLNAPIILIRTSGDPGTLLPSLRGGLQAVNPRLPLVRSGTMETVIGDSVATPRLSAMLLGVFSLLALLLASVGIYTIVSFTVAGRMPELGIRVALGAKGGRILVSVMGGMALTVAIGLLTGALVLALVYPQVQGLLFGVELMSLSTLLPPVSILLATVALASYLPARRATEVDPVEALRAQ
jgi:predicted permease